MEGRKEEEGGGEGGGGGGGEEEEANPVNLNRDSPSSGRVLTRDVHIIESYSVESVGRNPWWMQQHQVINERDEKAHCGAV